MSTTTGIAELLTGSSTPFLAAGDYVCFVDVADVTQSPSGSLVKGTLTQFFAQLPVPVAIKSASATAFTVGLNGATNPAFTVNAATALQVAGLKVTGAVTGGTVAVVVTDSGADSSLTINAKGTGTIGIGSVSTGRVTITPVVTLTGLVTTTAGFTGAVPFAGLATFNAGATVASGQTLTVTGATVTGLTAASVATGTFPGVYTITGALTLSAALTYGGVTLSNAVTGTGNMVLSASPTFTGTIVGAALNFSGAGTFAGTITNTNGAIVINSSGAAAFQLKAASGSSARTDHYINGVLQWQVGDAISTVGHWEVYDVVNSALALSITAGANPAVAFNGAVSGITTLALSSTMTFDNTQQLQWKDSGGTARRVVDLDASNNLNIGRAGVGHLNNTQFFTDGNYSFTDQNAVSSLTINAATKAVTFAGAVSGITTLAGTGAVSGFTSAAFSGTLSTTAALAVASGQKFYLDGVAASGDTYIDESSANSLRFTAGGVAGLILTTSIATFGLPIFGSNLSMNVAAPTVGAGQVGIGGTVATTASNGGGEAMKANVSGYLVINVAGTTFKVPYVAN